MKIESEKDNTSLLSLFLFTVQEYEAITAHILLPAPNDYSSISDPLGLRDSAIENLKATWAAMYLHALAGGNTIPTARACSCADIHLLLPLWLVPYQATYRKLRKPEFPPDVKFDSQDQNHF